MANAVDMRAYGLTERFAAEAARYAGLCVGRVISQGKELYRIVCAAGEYTAAISGKLRYEALTATELPTVGDFVMLDGAVDTGAAIRHVLPRKSLFVRKAAGKRGGEQLIAANIDTVFICMSLNKDFNLRRLERYLSIAWNSGSTPVLVLTKSDLCADTAERLAAAGSVSAGVDILITSALEEEGCARLRPYLGDGRTVALIGSSGVGKSTLINRLIGTDRMDTDGLRDDDKGRHTTTRRELIRLPEGGLVIDTPGMRELGMWESAEGLERSFADIEALIGQCRFRDCRHGGEPDCAVREALASGALDAERWRSYQKLRREEAATEHAADRLRQKEQKMKAIAKLNKYNKKR